MKNTIPAKSSKLIGSLFLISLLIGPGCLTINERGLPELTRFELVRVDKQGTPLSLQQVVNAGRSQQHSPTTGVGRAQQQPPNSGQNQPANSARTAAQSPGANVEIVRIEDYERRVGGFAEPDSEFMAQLSRAQQSRSQLPPSAEFSEQVQRLRRLNGLEELPPNGTEQYPDSGFRDLPPGTPGSSRTPSGFQPSGFHPLGSLASPASYENTLAADNPTESGGHVQYLLHDQPAAQIAVSNSGYWSMDNQWLVDDPNPNQAQQTGFQTEVSQQDPFETAPADPAEDNFPHDQLPADYVEELPPGRVQPTMPQQTIPQQTAPGTLQQPQSAPQGQTTPAPAISAPVNSVLSDQVPTTPTWESRNSDHYLNNEAVLQGQQFQIRQQPTATEYALHLKRQLQSKENELASASNRYNLLERELRLTVNTLMEANRALGDSRQQLTDARQQINELRREVQANADDHRRQRPRNRGLAEKAERWRRAVQTDVGSPYAGRAESATSLL